MIGSPLNLGILLHCHCIAAPLYTGFNTEAPAVKEGISFLEKEKMIYRDFEHGDHGYQTTAKGKAYVEYILRVPFPEQHWIVPGDTRPEA